MTGHATNARQPWSIVLASREVWPFIEAGGLGRYVWAAALLLSKHADVAILTTSRWRGRYEELAEAGQVPLPDVRFAFVDEPEGDISPFVSWHQAWSVHLLEGVAELYPDGGPDLLEMADYQAEGFAAAHARRGRDPRLRNTTLAIRLHTSLEMCAAMNEAAGDLHLDVITGLERFSLRFADALLEPGGNSLERYAEFYGDRSLAPALLSPLPMTTDLSPPADVGAPPADGPLRLLYLNRIERRKGIADLISAVRSLPEAELTLTVVGGDTPSGPGDTSMRDHAMDLAAGDSRIDFVDRIPHEAVPRVIAEHHAVVVPSRWETFSYVVREALACNRPVVATPAGAVVDVVRRGESGWLAESSSADALQAVLRDVLAERDELMRLIDEGLPRAAFDRDAPEERTLRAYEELVEHRRDTEARRNGTPASPRVTALVACEAGGGDPLPTLVSLDAQRGVDVRAIVVVEPSSTSSVTGPALALADAVVATAQDRNGRQAAWAEGLLHTSDELVLVLSAGAVLGYDFLRRAADALVCEPDVGWVTSFASAGDTPMHAPPGSYQLPLAELQASPSVALVRRTALEVVLLGDDEVPAVEADLFVRLAHAGAHGLVLQEPLFANLPRPVPPRAVAQR